VLFAKAAGPLATPSTPGAMLLWPVK